MLTGRARSDFFPGFGSFYEHCSERRVDWRHREHSSLSRNEVRLYGLFLGSVSEPVVHHALRGESIGVIESTLACPGTKLEHMAFFSVSSLSLRHAPIVIVIRQSSFCCCRARSFGQRSRSRSSLQLELEIKIELRDRTCSLKNRILWSPSAKLNRELDRPLQRGHNKHEKRTEEKMSVCAEKKRDTYLFM
jgi:hypothetical protein